MRNVLIFLFAAMFSFICHAQTVTIIKKDSSTFILKPYNFYLYGIHENNSVPILNYSFEFLNKQSRFTVFNNMTIYDKYRHEYLFINKPPNFQSALLGGTLYYLTLLFDKKK